jgi:hypothetical protein
MGIQFLTRLENTLKIIILEPYFVSYELFLGYKINVSLVDKVNKVELGVIMPNFEHPKTIFNYFINGQHK